MGRLILDALFLVERALLLEMAQLSLRAKSPNCARIPIDLPANFRRQIEVQAQPASSSSSNTTSVTHAMAVSLVATVTTVGHAPSTSASKSGV